MHEELLKGPFLLSLEGNKVEWVFGNKPVGYGLCSTESLLHILSVLRAKLTLRPSVIPPKSIGLPDEKFRVGFKPLRHK